MSPSDLREHLRAHDWYFEYSDDQRVWARGQAERNLLARYLSMYSEPEYVALVVEYAPKDPALKHITEDLIKEIRRVIEFREKNRPKGDV